MPVAVPYRAAVAFSGHIPQESTLRRIVFSIGSVLVLAAAAVTAAPRVAPSRAQELPPNVVIILTDDQRSDIPLDQTMPTVLSRIVEPGVSFSEAFVVNPLCCPSRSSLLTGQYSHTTGVYSNGGAFGGFDDFRDGSTLATWLDDAGYRTALIGKYLNGYEGPYVPPGWDRWVAFEKHDFFDYSLVIDGILTPFGADAVDYSTDVLADEAVSFVRGSAAEEPLFLYFAPYAPHAPATPAPRHDGAFDDLPPFRPPSYDETPIADKPDHIKSLPRIGPDEDALIDEFRRDQYRSLLAADDAVRRIWRALRQSGRLQNTVFVFMSDNGMHWGEHRWYFRKAVPYEESIRIPMAIRYDPLTSGSGTIGDFALNVDIAPTLAEIVGIAAPGVEGESLVPLIEGTAAEWRTDFVIEHVSFGPNKTVPPYCAVRNEGFLYAIYGTGEEELYDLAADPFQLQNQANRRQYSDVEASLRQRVEELCSPPPPGFVFPPA